MAINVMDIIKPNKVASLVCDSTSDFPDLPEFAKSNGLKMGTTCMVIDTAEVYMMNSSYEFKKI